MVLIRTDWSSFEDYIASLSKSARKNFKHVSKLYDRFPYREVTFDRAEVEFFMRLWAKQLVRGKPIKWAYGVGYVENLWLKGRLKIFKAENRALHFIVKEENFWTAEPPLYDKCNNELGTWLWFQLFKFAIENKLEPLNMGGGVDEWRVMLRMRKEFPNPAYKFRFVPQSAKDNPDSEPDYFIDQCKLHLKE